MKIRNGFVSNSSSSSFVLLTKGLDEKVLKEVQNLVYIMRNYEGGECGAYLNEAPFAYFGEVAYDLKFIKEDNSYKLFDWENDYEADGIDLNDVLLELGVPKDHIAWGD